MRAPSGRTATASSTRSQARTIVLRTTNLLGGARLSVVRSAMLLLLFHSATGSSAPNGWGFVPATGARRLPGLPRVQPVSPTAAASCSAATLASRCSVTATPADPIELVARPAAEGSPAINCTAAGAVGCVRFPKPSPDFLVDSAEAADTQPFTHELQPPRITAGSVTFTTLERSSDVYLWDVNGDGKLDLLLKLKTCADNGGRGNPIAAAGASYYSRHDCYVDTTQIPDDFGNLPYLTNAMVIYLNTGGGLWKREDRGATGLTGLSDVGRDGPLAFADVISAADAARTRAL